MKNLAEGVLSKPKMTEGGGRGGGDIIKGIESVKLAICTEGDLNPEIV